MKKHKKKKQRIVEHSFSILPILILLFFVWGIRFLSGESTQNLTKKSDAIYEQKLINENYAYRNDLNYKKDIIRKAGKYSLPDLSFLVGPQELEDYMKKYNDSYTFYAYGKYNPQYGTYLRERKIMANLNIHSSLSDGHISVKDILEQAASYADELADANSKNKFLIAITDINTMDNAKIIIDTIKDNPERYKNLKVVFGIEAPTVIDPNDYIEEVYQVNLVALCINPFDKAMLKEFPKNRKFNADNQVEHSFDDVTTLFNTQNSLVYGISKPLLYVHNASNSYKYIKSTFNYYKTVNPKLKFVSAYYDPYTYTKSPEVSYMMDCVNLYNFYKIGGLQLYGDNLFEPD